MVYNGQSIYKWAYFCSKPWAPWQLPEAVEMEGQRLAAVFVRATQGHAVLPYLPYPVDPMVSKVVDMRRALRLTSQVLRCGTWDLGTSTDVPNLGRTHGAKIVKS